MRVISGENRGTRLKAVPGAATRPTADKVKESIFNMIGPYFDGGVAVDLCAGSGALGIEALSRGAEEAYFFDPSEQAIRTVRQNVEKCRLEPRAHIVRMKAERASAHLSDRGGCVSLLFLDPPYRMTALYEQARQFAESGLMADGGAIVCEHDQAVELPPAYGSFALVKRVRYSDTAVSIYRKTRGEGAQGA